MGFFMGVVMSAVTRVVREWKNPLCIVEGIYCGWSEWLEDVSQTWEAVRIATPQSTLQVLAASPGPILSKMKLRREL